MTYLIKEMEKNVSEQAEEIFQMLILQLNNFI